MDDGGQWRRLHGYFGMEKNSLSINGKERLAVLKSLAECKTWLTERRIRALTQCQELSGG
jgi:hypothetical protein